MYKDWMSITLSLAGIYNIAWGAFVVILPQYSYEIFNLPEPLNVVIWQSMGMVIGCYGIAYVLASYNPIKNWAIVLVGLLGKVLGPLGFVYSVIMGKYPIEAGFVHITNDLIWLIPFSLILLKAHKHGKLD